MNIRTLFLFLATLVTPFLAHAQNNVIVLDDIAQVEVLNGWRTKSGTHMAGVRITLAPGWHTYWRAPGDAGIPPKFDLGRSKNLSAVRVHWPTPVAFDQGGSRSIGYENQVILPIELTPTTDGSIKLRGKLDIGVCDDICLPMSVDLNADLASSGAKDPEIMASLANRPASAKKAGLKSVTCIIDPIPDGMRISADLSLPRLGKNEVAVVELADKRVWISSAKTTRNGRVLTAIADMVPPNAAPFVLQRSDIRITVIGEKSAVEIQGCTAG